MHSKIYIIVLLAVLSSCKSQNGLPDASRNDDNSSTTNSQFSDRNLLIGDWQTPSYVRIRFRDGGTLAYIRDNGAHYPKYEGRYTIISDNKMTFETSASKDELFFTFPDNNTLLIGESEDALEEFRRIID